MLLHGVIRIYYYGDLSTMEWVLSLSTMAICGVSYFLMVVQSRLGGDLSLKGATSQYFEDFIFVGSTVMVLTIFSSKFFGLWILVLGYILYKGISMLMPWISPSPAPPVDAATLKREAKKVRRAEMQQKRSKGK